MEKLKMMNDLIVFQRRWLVVNCVPNRMDQFLIFQELELIRRDFLLLHKLLYRRSNRSKNIFYFNTGKYNDLSIFITSNLYSR